MSELIMLVGVPGSGKSTYIKKINADGKYVVISTDDVLEEIASDMGLTYSDVHRTHIGFATKEMFNRAKKAISDGKPIIWDQTNMTVKSRKKKLNMFPSSYDKKAIVFSIDDFELKKRLKKRAEETGKFIPDHVIKSMINSYIAPSKSEGFSKIQYIK